MAYASVAARLAALVLVLIFVLLFVLPRLMTGGPKSAPRPAREQSSATSGDEPSPAKPIKSLFSDPSPAGAASPSLTDRPGGLYAAPKAGN